MQKRHEDVLYARLERVVTHGVTEISREELKLWFGADRIARGTWRKIYSYWREVTEKHSDKTSLTLFVGGIDNSSWVFIWGEGLKDSSKSWFQDIRRWTGDMDEDGELISVEDDHE